MKRFMALILVFLVFIVSACDEPVDETAEEVVVEEPDLIIFNDTRFDLDVYYKPDDTVDVTATIASGGSFEVEDNIKELTIVEGSF